MQFWSHLAPCFFPTWDHRRLRGMLWPAQVSELGAHFGHHSGILQPGIHVLDNHSSCGQHLHAGHPVQPGNGDFIQRWNCIYWIRNLVVNCLTVFLKGKAPERVFFSEQWEGGHGNLLPHLESSGYKLQDYRLEPPWGSETNWWQKPSSFIGRTVFLSVCP